MSARAPVLRALVPVVCPPRALELGLADAIVDGAERTIGALPTLLQHGLTAGLLGMDNAARLHPGARGRPLRRLPHDLAYGFFYAWLHGPLPPQQLLAKSVRQMIALACYEQPAMLADIGYTPEAWIDKVRTHRLRVYHADIATHRAQTFAPDPLRPGRGVQPRSDGGAS